MLQDLFARIQIVRNTAILRHAKDLSAKTHFENKQWWGVLQKAVDYKHN